MSYYFIANIDIKDNEEYQKYIDKAGDIFAKYNGRYLAVDNAPTQLEGDWNYTRLVLIEFKTKSDFSSWYDSDDYQLILKHRLKGANCDTILAEGLKK